VLACVALFALTVPTGIVTAGGTPVWVTPAVTAPGVSQQVFYSAAVGASVSYHIYRPPANIAQPERRFPVLYWLHGASSVLTGIATVSGIFNSAIASDRRALSDADSAEACARGGGFQHGRLWRRAARIAVPGSLWVSVDARRRAVATGFPGRRPEPPSDRAAATNPRAGLWQQRSCV